ncbi:MAG: dihydrofolate reductase [Alloprevotella sp.]|nr:dihydrofolate reductase [Prevotellamassilia sp.]MDY5761785.1 dihydrofolate reductase [Alloprevotella sp.]
MKKTMMTMMMATAATFGGSVEGIAQTTDGFQYTDERFADIQMLRYKVEGFDNLTLKQKTFIYYLQEAALQGRDILFDQNGRYNLRIRRLLEAIYTDYKGDRKGKFYTGLSTYLKRVWFSSGIHHHYGCEKFVPSFTADELRAAARQIAREKLNLPADQTVDDLCDELIPVMFDPTVMPMRVNQKDGDDLVLTSGCNYYAPGITQAEAEKFYTERKAPLDPRPVMMGMNSRLVRNADGELTERVWRVGGLYGSAIEKIVENLLAARPYADTPAQQKVIDLLVEFYRTGDLRTFDDYSIQWLKDTESLVDFNNCFTESYGDPLGMKASWEAIVNFKNLAATARTEKLSANAQWFEDHSPVDARFKKEQVKGVSAKVITAAILGGDLYPSTAIGINLPNSDWVRREHGSKSVTIGNLTDAYNKAAHGNGMDAEFVIDEATRKIINTYGDACDDLHTDLHECLGHGSGKLLPGTDPDTLKAYGSTIEEARADLFGLYYVADPKLVELGLTPNLEAYKSQYYSYMLNGLMTQLVRINLGNTIEEAHMRNRALIARWAYEHGRADKVVELVKKKGKTYVKINDYEKLRHLFGQLLAEIQRIKSEGDYEAARRLVEDYAVQIDPALHKEVLTRYEKLNLSPYKGFINPVYKAVRDAQGRITDVTLDYTEAYDAQMLRYSHDYNTLPDVNE